MSRVDITNIDDFRNDETVELLLDGVSIGSVNYDEHGSSGLDLLEEIAENLARLNGCEITYD